MLQLPVTEAVQTAMASPLTAPWAGDGVIAYGTAALDEQQALRSDLRLAAAVQRQMLPRGLKPLATICCAGTTAAAAGLGGDYFDFLDLGPDSLGVVLADVSGKGMAAALLAASLQASLRSECARGIDSLAAVLMRVNTRLYESTLPEQYATLFFGRYDDRTRRLEYVNCGQQPALMVRSDRSVERLQSTALPVGLFENWIGDTQTVELQPGDMLCVCSDGVVEAGVGSGCEFGEDRLLSVLATNTEPDVERTVTRVAQAARLYGPMDDMTVVGLLAAQEHARLNRVVSE
jgi:serine phosphatase RsbU (regulator of sigma subunit)